MCTFLIIRNYCLMMKACEGFKPTCRMQSKTLRVVSLGTQSPEKAKEGCSLATELFHGDLKIV